MILQKIFILPLFIAGLVACGDDKKEENKTTPAPDAACTYGSVGCGIFVPSQDDKISISFEKSASGDKYVVMPFSVGSTDAVDGAGSEKFSFDVPVGKANLSGGRGKRIFAIQPGMEADKRADTNALAKRAAQLGRVIFNRWNVSLGLKGQSTGFWEMVRAYDQVREQLVSMNGLNDFHQEESLEAGFLRALTGHRDNFVSSVGTNLVANDCPGANGEVLLPGTSAGNPEVYDVGEVVSGTDYCIIYMDTVFGANNADDKEAIETSIKTLLKSYKSVIYKDEFKAVNGYTFKPIFVIIDPTNSDYGMNPAFQQFLGAFTQNETVASKMPMLYLASDLSKIDGYSNDATGKAAFHATLAHELQHAISFYYRGMKPGSAADQVIETVFVDEGIAHTMEDVFGYGTEEFKDYAGVFLSYFANGLNPFLAGAKFPEGKYAGDDFNYYRGSAQALLYYLLSQKGGVDFKDGIVSGGGGMQYLADLVTSGKVGAKNLKETFAHPTWAWPETVANFLGALVLDNSGVQNIGVQYQAKAPFQEVTDLQGTKNKVFGMRFNNFGAIKDATADGAANPYTAFDAVELELYHYHTRPGLVTVSEAAKPVEIGSPDDLGSGAAVVRIK